MMFPTRSKETSRRIRVAIRRVLMQVWDPIGVKDEPLAWNEYDGYLGGFYDLLLANASDDELQHYLDSCIANMGMNASRKSDSEVISALRAIDLKEY